MIVILNEEELLTLCIHFREQKEGTDIAGLKKSFREWKEIHLVVQWCLSSPFLYCHKADWPWKADDCL